MIKNYKISVIVPFFNVEKYIEACIISILNQTMDKENYEIILVNDGSEDNSKYIAEKYLERYSNIKIINQMNQGLSAARNSGIKVANGEYLFFLDSDDLIGDNTMFETVYQEASNNNLDVVLFDADIFYDDGFEDIHYNISKDVYNRSNIIDSKEILTGREFFKKYYCKDGYKAPVWMLIVNREFLIQNNLFFAENLLHEDEEFSFRLNFLVNRMKYIPRKFLKYRRRKNSITTTKITKKHFVSFISIVEKNLDLVNTMKQNLIFSERVNLEQYLLDYFKAAIDKFILLDVASRESVVDLINLFIKKFITQYALISESTINLKEILIINSIENKLEHFNSIKSYFEKIIYEVYDLGYDEVFKEKINKKRIEMIKNVLCDVELNSVNANVGIYGLGKHTEQLLHFYTKYIGKVKSNLIFIDSNKVSFSTKFMERDVINVKDISKCNVDQVIISSASYEAEMLNTLKKCNYNKKIVTFYENNRGNLFEV